ncbi:hypothetical protein Tco_1495890, partial [Tanacetum coccineum]
MDMFRDILHFLMETPENPFVAPVSIKIIEAFMNRVGYQGVVNKVSAFYMKNLAQPWQTMIIIPSRMIFHWLLCILLGMCLTEEIRATDDIKESTPRAHRTPTLTASPQGKKRKHSARESSSPQKSLKIIIRQQKVVEGNKDDDDSEDRLELESHKDKPEHVDDDDDKYDEKVDEEEGRDMGSLETRTEKMQTPIPTPPRSPRTILSSDKNITQDLTETVHFAGCVDVRDVSELAEKAIEKLIENNLKPCIAATIIKDHDAFRSEVPDLVSQEFNAQAPKIIEELFKNYIQSNVIQIHPTTITSTETTSSADLQQQLYFKMERSLQNRANDPALWE